MGTGLSKGEINDSYILLLNMRYQAATFPPPPQKKNETISNLQLLRGKPLWVKSGSDALWKHICDDDALCNK